MLSIVKVRPLFGGREKDVILLNFLVLEQGKTVHSGCYIKKLEKNLTSIEVTLWQLHPSNFQETYLGNSKTRPHTIDKIV